MVPKVLFESVILTTLSSPSRSVCPVTEHGCITDANAANAPVCGRSISRQVLWIQLPKAASADYNLCKFTLLSLQCVHCQ